MAIFGILNVNKPAGPSSRDVVNRVVRITQPAKAGHAGTLDPLATGVLVICVGQATRLIRYVQRMPKRYRATYLLGRRSETDDVEGEVIVVPDAAVPTRAMLEQALPQFVGEIDQRPPAHSAIKIAGRRSYQLARRGEAMELAARKVTIHQLVVRRYEYPELELELECGSGTYVRALGRDLAAALGTSAVMSALERTAIGGFRIDDAVSFDDLVAETLPKNIQPALTAVADLPRVALGEAQLVEIRHGRPITKGDADLSAVGAAIEYAAVNDVGDLVAILREKRPGELWPDKNFV